MSAPVRIAVVDDPTPPTVAFVALANGASFIEGRPIFVQANAADNVGVERVEFRANGMLFQTDTTPAYTGIFTTPGNYADAGPTPLMLTATAFDRAGLSATATVNVTVVPDQPPTIALIQAPPDNSNVIEGTSVVFAAVAADDVGVVVDLFVDGVLRQTRSNAPFSFTLPAPPAAGTTNPMRVVLTARDTQGQTASTPPVRLNVIRDNPPTVLLTSPAAGAQLAEGSLLTVAATVTDDVGVARVEFLVDGASVGTDTTAPYAVQARLGAGPDGSVVSIQAVATDTAGQTAQHTIALTRRDDTVPPTVAITAPHDGAIASVGPSDVVIVIDTSGSTSGSCGADVDGDGVTDSILKCEVLAAKELLNFLNPTTTQVAVVDFASFATLVRLLTSDFTLVRQALDNILRAGPGGGTNFSAAMQVATNELVGRRARRNATPVQLFLSDGVAAFPGSEVTRAADGGVVVNTFAVGAGADPTVLTRIAHGTGGVFTPVVNPGELMQILPNIILFGMDALVVIANATDDVAVADVAFRYTSANGMVDTTITDTAPPFNAIFSLPALTAPLEMTATATVRDFGGNAAAAAPITVTVLPAENTPQIVRLNPARGVVGGVVDIVGTFFAPITSNNMVTFNNTPATITSDSKIMRRVTVPSGAGSGPVLVRADGFSSNPVAFIIDTDSDGLWDEQELLRGTDPLRPDTDGDQLLDGFEVHNGFDPLTPGEATQDPDGDGLDNLTEQAQRTHPRNPDTDGDGLTDGEEVTVFFTDPLDRDTDGGGRSDGDEVLSDGTNPLDPNDDLLSLSLPTTLVDGSAFLWDIEGDGSISDGSSDAYDDGLRLSVNGLPFGFFNDAALEDAGRSLRIGPWVMDGLLISRKLFVPANDAFARFLEIIENTTATDLLVTIRIDTNLGLDRSTVLVSTSSGDAVFDTTDDFIITDDGSDGGGDPMLVHVFSGPGAAVGPSAVSLSFDDLQYTFQVMVPSGERRIIMHFASQHANRFIAALSAGNLRNLRGRALDGLTPEEQNDIVNFAFLP